MVHSTIPPLADACSPTTWTLFNFLLKYGASAQCADPVTGSSSIPTFGPKKRERKSTFLFIYHEGVVQQTITPRLYPSHFSIRTKSMPSFSLGEGIDANVSGAISTSRSSPPSSTPT
eukprot:CAMPEP_0197240494 /NCGR_PEP_ID=MMETSP1429-20130617/6770_1 /TAXON_ID=49237 /ORGANISM="Chaetoceros  sp., Strain UNC1202" /LENGTH=116 /DNA_ID=CAMNT_0042700143 /DNA_START=81 /DNA_END=431 /DNA_ORIENTATION=+